MEQELAPGIFFTAAPKTRTSAPGVAGGGNEGTNGMPAAPNVGKMTREELEWEYRSIGKTISKLKESNELMAEFDKGEKDSVLTDAISENRDIIARGSERLAIVKERLDYLIRSMPHIKPCRPEELKTKLAPVLDTKGGATSNATGQGEEAAASSDALAALNIDESANDEEGTTPNEEEALGMDL